MKKLPIFDLNKDVLLKVFKHEQRPIGLLELEKKLYVGRKDRKVLKTLLNNMLREGLLIKLKNKRFAVPYEMNLETGTLSCTRSGNGFLIPDNKKEKGARDIFIPSRYMKNAFHGDRVIARIERTTGGKKEGKIIRVTERRLKNITGFIKKDKKLIYLIPDDERLQHSFFVPHGSAGKEIEDGDLAAARITKFPGEGGNPECKIIKTFKELADINTITTFIKYKYSLPLKFKKIVEEEADKIKMEELDRNRIDLRDLKHVTIDGESAKDFDDAVLVQKTKNGYILYVSIADVSHYVLPNTNLDKEAYSRGTSIYFPKAVIPMLPKKLSNVLCSLNPNEERLSLTVKLVYDKQGDLLQSSFHQSIIKSAMRLTYHLVEDALINKDSRTIKEVGNLLPELELLSELAFLLAEKRKKRGSLDFDLPEPEVVLDIEGGVKSILRSERFFSHKIIEEFMISANEAVAQFLSKKGIPAIYRVHESPDQEKLKDFEKLLHAIPGQHNKTIKNRFSMQSILDQMEDTNYEYLLNRVLLRSMKQARYSASNRKHFGLALDCYLHFTSPIRRYPDLICHRALKNAMHGNHMYSEEELELMAIHLSERERLAMEVEREIEDRIRILYMKDKTGHAYNGIISHITSFGFFVELLDVFVEGLVLLTDLYDDYYLFQEDKFRLMGRRTKKIYRIGDKVKIRVILADVEKNQLHFGLV